MTPSMIHICVLFLACLLLPVQAALVERQTPPNCTLSCMTKQDRSACASNSDNKCLCKQPAFTSNMHTCLSDKCASGDLAAAISAIEGMCRVNGASVTLGPGGGGGSSPSPTTAGSPSSPTKKSGSIANSANPSWLILSAAGLVGLAL